MDLPPSQDTNLLHPRSRAGSNVSTTQVLLEGLQLASSPFASPLLEPSSTFITGTAGAAPPSSPASNSALSYQDPSAFQQNQLSAPSPLAPPGLFLSSPSNPPSPSLPSSIPSDALYFGLLDEDRDDASFADEWLSISQADADPLDQLQLQEQLPHLQDPPLLRIVDAAAIDDLSQSRPTSAASAVFQLQPLPSDSATMSAATALHYDPAFGMGSRSSFPNWQGVIEPHNDFLGRDFSSYGSDTSLSPPTASRSVTASPPRLPVGLTAQQRELKRQRDQARRDSKISSRRARAGSSSSSFPSSAVPPHGTVGLVSATATATSSPPLSSSTALPSSPAAAASGSSSRATTAGATTTTATTTSPPRLPPPLTPSTTSYMQHSPPLPPGTMSDLTAGVAASTSTTSASTSASILYSTTAPPHNISLLSEPIATSNPGTMTGLTSSAYMPAGGPYSPPISDPNGPSPFSQSYQTSSYMPDYAHGYSTPGMSYNRSSIPDQNSMMYPMTPHLPPPPRQHPSHPHAHGMPQHLPSHAYVPAPAGPSSYMPQAPMPNQGHPSPPLPGVDGSGSTMIFDSNTGNLIGSSSNAPRVRVMDPQQQERQKPRCWEHGCNGRQFSTFSNLLRHQREKSGQAAKAVCPNCGAEFTRTTARNGHLLHDKCKQRRNT